MNINNLNLIVNYFAQTIPNKLFSNNNMSDENFKDYNERFIQRGLLCRTLNYQYFWCGNLINYIRYYPEQIIFFTLKNKLKFLSNSVPNDNIVQITLKQMIVGWISGLVSLGIFYHVDYVCIRFANDSTNQFSGINDVYMKTISLKGISGLYHGFLFSWASITIYRMYTFICIVILLTHPFMIIQKQMIMASQGVVAAYSEVVNNNVMEWSWCYCFKSSFWTDIISCIFGQTLLAAFSNINSISLAGIQW
jgi:hypothetical protein